MLPAPLQESGVKSPLGRRRRLGVGLAAICALGLVACGGGEGGQESEPEGEFPVELTSAEFPARQSLAEAHDLVLSVTNSGDEQIPNLAITFNTEAEPDVVLDAGEADPADAGADGENPEQLAEEVEQQLQEELDAAAEQAEQDADGSEQEAGTETGTDEGEVPLADGPFSTDSDQPGLARRSRPVWILEQGYPTLVGAEIPPGPPGEIAAASGALTAQTNTFAFGPLDPEDSLDLVWRVTPVQAGTYTVRYRVAAGLQGNAVAVTEDGGVPEGEFVVRITDAPPQRRVNSAGKVVPIKPGDVSGQVESAATE